MESKTIPRTLKTGQWDQLSDDQKYNNVEIPNETEVSSHVVSNILTQYSIPATSCCPQNKIALKNEKSSLTLLLLGKCPEKQVCHYQLF